MKKWYAAALLIYNLLVIYLLISGSSLLLKAIPGLEVLPFGNLLTWMFMFALPLNFIVIANATGLKGNTIASKGFYWFTGIALILGLFWGVMARLITSNWQFIISGNLPHQTFRVQVFWFYSFAVPILPFVGLIWLWLIRLLTRSKDKK